MKISDFEAIIEKQFDTMVKKVISDTAKNYRKQKARREKHEFLLSDVAELESLGTRDEYGWDSIEIEVVGLEKVKLYNEDLIDALTKLSKRKRNIVLMFYFLEMSDSEISKILNISRRTSLGNRKDALKAMKQTLSYKEES